MKTSKSLAVILITTAGLGLVLAGCGKSSNKGSNPTSKTSMQNPTKDKTAKEALTSNDNLWYMNGSINYKSKTGIDAYKFDKAHNTVTIYSVGKMYKTYDDAKKANDLDKQGTLKYSFKNDSAENPVIYMKGKLSDIPMDQTVSVKGKVSGKYHASDLKVSGFKVVRNLDNDDAKQVLVTPGH